MEGDAALEQLAQQRAEAALAAVPPSVMAAKLPMVKEAILKRLRSQADEAGGAPEPVTRPDGPAAPGARPAAPETAPAAPREPPPPPLPQLVVDLASLEPAGIAEACGDEPWFADQALRRMLLEATAAKHAEQKILVGVPADEIRRICPSKDRTLGAGAVLRLGGAHHGGYGDQDVKYAYRQLSRALHPDKNPNVPEAPDAFKRLSEAAEELKRSLEEARGSLRRLGGAVGSDVTPEMLERPQVPLLAEACKLLYAVLALTGEGSVPDGVRARNLTAFQCSRAFAGCSGQSLLARWYDGDDLLDVLSSGPLRIAYDCAPKRFRAQFLGVLSRAAAAEAARNESCVRGGWQKALAQFPEVGLWREFFGRLRCRVLVGVDGGQAPADISAEAAAEAAATAGSPGDTPEASAPLEVSDWAAPWREIIGAVLPRAGHGAAAATDPELRHLAIALWKDVAAWARAGGAARHLELFAAGGRSGHAGVDRSALEPPAWAFVPAADLLLTVGEGVVGIGAEGAFCVPSSAAACDAEPRASFASAFRRARRSVGKRGLAAAELDRPAAKKAKLNRGPTRVVLLSNMVGAGEVDEDLQEETEDEAAKFGKLRRCVIQETPGAPDSEAVRIFLEFEKVDGAAKAYAAMNGRYFGGRTVKARFYDEARFEKGCLEKRAPTRVVLITNLVNAEDLDDDLETETFAEAARFGKVRRCVLRKAPGDEAARVFVEFDSPAAAAKAVSAINGREVAGREVRARFFDEGSFAAGDFAAEE